MFFRYLGFYEIASANGIVVFMENRKNGFSSYLTQLNKETDRHVSANPSLSGEDERPVSAGQRGLRPSAQCGFSIRNSPSGP